MDALLLIVLTLFVILPGVYILLLWEEDTTPIGTQDSNNG